MAFTSMLVVTMAALFLVISTMAVQTVATRPEPDGYAAATSIDKSVEPTGGEATTVATAKPTEEYVKPTGGAKAAEDDYAKAFEITETADKYMKEAATTTSPEKAAFSKKAADLLSVLGKKEITLGNKAAKEDGEQYVTPKNLEALSTEIKEKIKPLSVPGDKSPKSISLLTAATYTHLAEKDLKDAKIATSPEQVAASKKAANDNFISALLYLASGAQGKRPSVAVGTTVDVKTDKQASDAATEIAATYQSNEVVPKEASPKETNTAVDEKTGKQASDAATENAATYQSKDAAPKEASPKEAYTAVDDKTGEKATDAATETAATYPSKDVTPKEVSPKEAYTAVDEKTGKQASDAATENAATYQFKDAPPKEASPKEAYTAVDEKTGKQASDAATENAATYQFKDAAPKEASPKEAYTAVDDKTGEKATDAATETAATYPSKDVAPKEASPKEAYTAGSA